MKIKFKSTAHRKMFTEYITANVKNPYLSRNEYVAAVFLLSADKFLWKKARAALTGYFMNFKSLDIAGISTEGYALFTAAKAVYHGSVDISFPVPRFVLRLPQKRPLKSNVTNVPTISSAPIFR